MTPQFSPAWQRYFAQTASPAAPPPRGAPLVAPDAGRRVPTVGSYATGGHAGTVAGATSKGRPEASGTSASVPPIPGAGVVPPARPRPPVDRRPSPPEPPRRERELAWLTWQMPERLREAARENLRQTLGWRAQYCGPLDPPKTTVACTRFGLVGEQLVPKGAITVRKTLREELRETIRAMEGQQPRLERNHALAMRGARLGQLCAELEQRGIDALEEVRCGLVWLWDEGAMPVVA